MYNWSVDEEKFKWRDPKAYRIWVVEQMINYGLGGRRLNERFVKKNWAQLSMDPITRRYLERLLWQKRSISLQKSKKRS